jgi:hypothetical protein
VWWQGVKPRKKIQWFKGERVVKMKESIGLAAREWKEYFSFLLSGE